MAMTPTRRKIASMSWPLLAIVVILGFWYPIAGLSMLICMISPLLLAAKKGRHWCGWICPRGSFFDLIMSKASPNKPLPKWLSKKATRYTILVILFGLMGYQLSMAWGDAAEIGFVFWRLLVITTLVGVVLALGYKPRGWCSICPVGTLSSLIANNNRKVQVHSGCKSCGICSKVCPMELKPHLNTSSQSDCLGCEQCVAKCPFGQLSMSGKHQEVSIEQKSGNDNTCGYLQ